MVLSRLAPLVVGMLAVLAIVLSVWRLEGARSGLTAVPLTLPGGPPATLWTDGGTAPAPVVVVAHGFAGSRQLMESQALTLARAGYLVATFDFMGHGRNPAPMRGDVMRTEGTTPLMVAEVRAVAQAALAHPRADGRLALVGHSMATDLVIRAALEEPRTRAVVAISMFSPAVTAEAPRNLLAITGQWEPALRAEALRALRLADPTAAEGQTTGDPAAGTGRRAAVAPWVEHVGVLYSTVALAETTAWLNAAFGRAGGGPAAARGPWVLLLLGAVVALAWPLARALPAGPPPPAPDLPPRLVWGVLAGLAVAVPVVATQLRVQVLPVLVADYLALHLMLWGLALLAFLGWRGGLRGLFPARVWPVALAFAGFAILGFGGALDRYVANFVPHDGRAWIIAVLALGTLPAMLADAVLTRGGQAGAGRSTLVRGALILSLALAVALDFWRLLFLAVNVPVLVLYFLVFGTLAGWIGRRTGLPAAAGIGSGLMLAWTLGVTFPLLAG